MNHDTDLERAVRKSGRNMTKQREAILETLQGTTSHPTGQQLLDIVREGLPGLTLATVYRNLSVLEELGLVRQLDTGEASDRYDARTDDHSHARCLECGRVDDVELEVSEDLMAAAEAATGYVIEKCELLFKGLCPNCQD
jgi:Fe2+ or Zn2+ uptake regulation protein